MINYSEYIHANLVNVARTCGNKNCRCITKGQKHVSLYLTTVRKDGVRQMVARYFRIRDIIEQVSDINLKRVLAKKK